MIWLLVSFAVAILLGIWASDAAPLRAGPPLSMPDFTSVTRTKSAPVTTLEGCDYHGDAVIGSGLALLLLIAAARLFWWQKQAKLRAAQLLKDARYLAARRTSTDGYLVLDERGIIMEANESIA